LDSVRVSAWLLFAVALVTIRASDGSGPGRAYLLGAVGFCLAAIANDARTLVVNPEAAALYTSQLLMRIGFGVAGLLTIENFWRNTGPERRWHVWPLCVAIGGLFAYELFLFSDAFITRGRVNPGLALGRPIVAGFMAPLLALAMARNREWRVDIHVSRQVVLHTATLVASGCFLVAVAVVADRNVQAYQCLILCQPVCQNGRQYGRPAATLRRGADGADGTIHSQADRKALSAPARCLAGPAKA